MSALEIIAVILFFMAFCTVAYAIGADDADYAKAGVGLIVSGITFLVIGALTS